MKSVTEKDKTRFWRKVKKLDIDKCWEWTAGKDTSGYGKFKWDGKDVGSHRFSWMIANDKEIPEEMYVCHSCDNPSCVNPNHLWLGTPSENIKDSFNKGRTARDGDNSHCAKLTAAQVLKLREEYNKLPFGDKKKFKQTQANKFGVSYYTIRSAINGNSWRDI